jgi:hypothetical protein
MVGLMVLASIVAVFGVSERALARSGPIGTLLELSLPFVIGIWSAIAGYYFGSQRGRFGLHSESYDRILDNIMRKDSLDYNSINERRIVPDIIKEKIKILDETNKIQFETLELQRRLLLEEAEINKILEIKNEYIAKAISSLEETSKK